MGMAQGSADAQGGYPDYLRVARFKRDAAAKRVYTQVQEAIRPSDCDLSCYNLRLNGEPTVVVVGDAPSGDLDERLRRMLAAGTPGELPRDVVLMLAARGIEERQKGPWSEGHYGPGKRLV